MLPSELLLLIASFTLTHAITIPRPPRPATPILPPKIPLPIPNFHPVPVVPVVPNMAPQQAVVQANVGRLEQTLKYAEDAADFGMNLVGAVLDTSTPTPTSGLVLTSNAPTPTFAYSDLAPCLSYASILSSCAAATTSFFGLPHSVQASCACVSTSTATPTNMPTCTRIVQKWDDRYNGYEAGCWGFFNATGFTAIKDAMDSNAALPGRDLCKIESSARVSASVTKSGVWAATSTIGSCARRTASESVKATVTLRAMTEGAGGRVAVGTGTWLGKPISVRKKICWNFHPDS